MLKIINSPLDEIIDFSLSKTNGSNFTKSFIQEHKGDVPVYGASLNEKEVTYGYVQDNLSGIKYFDNCLTWNIDGSTGVFLREGHFSLSEKVIPLIPFKNIRSLIDLNYLKYAIMFSKEYSEFGFSNKAGKNKLKKIKVPFPILEDGGFDLEKQKELAQKYKDVEEKKKILLDKIEDMKKYKIIFELNNTKYKEVYIKDLFTPKNGNSIYTKEWCQNHQGHIPLYSGNTQGAFQYIDTADYDGEYITWAKDGLAGYMLYHNGKFSLTGHRGILIPTKNAENIDLKYMKYVIEPIFRNKIKGRLGINGKNEYTTLNSTMIKNIKEKIIIPIKDNGDFDLEKQRELAQKYAALDTYKQNIYNQIKELVNISIN